MNLTLFDRNIAMVDAWKDAFYGRPVTITSADFRELSADAIVSPANSFGFMDGGIDQAYSEHFGTELAVRLREKIRLYNELPEIYVGQAISVEIKHPGGRRPRYLICAPTMRVPSAIIDPAAVYLSTRAALYLAQKNHWSVLMPGMGTGAGSVPHALAAQRMRQAYDEVMAGPPRQFSGFDEARKCHYGVG